MKKDVEKIQSSINFLTEYRWKIFLPTTKLILQYKTGLSISPVILSEKYSQEWNENLQIKM